MWLTPVVIIRYPAHSGDNNYRDFLFFESRGKNEFSVVIITVISRFSFFPNCGKNEFEKQWTIHDLSLYKFQLH